MDELELALRKFKAARKKVTEMYPSRYSDVYLAVRWLGYGENRVICNIYVDVIPHTFEAPTWEEAFRKIKEWEEKELKGDS